MLRSEDEKPRELSSRGFCLLGSFRSCRGQWHTAVGAVRHAGNSESLHAMFSFRINSYVEIGARCRKSAFGVGFARVADDLHGPFFEPFLGLADIVESLAQLFELSRTHLDALPDEQCSGL